MTLDSSPLVWKHSSSLEQHLKTKSLLPFLYLHRCCSFYPKMVFLACVSWGIYFELFFFWMRGYFQGWPTVFTSFPWLSVALFIVYTSNRTAPWSLLWPVGHTSVEQLDKVQFRAMDKSRAQGSHRDQTHDVSLMKEGHSLAELTSCKCHPELQVTPGTPSPRLPAMGSSLWQALTLPSGSRYPPVLCIGVPPPSWLDHMRFFLKTALKSSHRVTT